VEELMTSILRSFRSRGFLIDVSHGLSFPVILLKLPLETQKYEPQRSTQRTGKDRPTAMTAGSLARSFASLVSVLRYCPRATSVI
jgi:hypothetical protein